MDLNTFFHETLLYIVLTITPEVGIYKNKQESKKTRKHAFDQEGDQKKRKHALDQK